MNLSAITPPPMPAGEALRLAGAAFSTKPGGVNKVSKRQMARAATASKLISVAREMFEKVGYFDTGIRDIAAGMNMSTGAVFSIVPDKASLWRLAMGSPPPSEPLAEEVALLLALRPGWGWLLKHNGKGFFATLTSPDYDPVRGTGQIFVAPSPDSPAAALRKCRLDCDAFNARPDQ